MHSSYHSQEFWYLIALEDCFKANKAPLKIFCLISPDLMRVKHTLNGRVKLFLQIF